MKKEQKSNQERKLLQWTKFLTTPEKMEVSDMENDEAIKKALEELEKIQEDGTKNIWQN